MNGIARGAMAIVIAVVVGAIALIVMAFQYDMFGAVIMAGLASVVPLVKHFDEQSIAKKVADARKAGGYEE
jgi:hypothetical protein